MGILFKIVVSVLSVFLIRFIRVQLILGIASINFCV